jgi:hypothetical protein
VHSFFGNACYYRRFIENFTKIALPLFILLSKENEFVWTNECHNDFEAAIEKISTTPMLWGPNWLLSFPISTDSLDTTIGAVL